jgi:CO/xanthine dehydrogenase Mo-binding subunit
MSADNDAAPARKLPGNLQTNPVLSQWIKLRREGVVEICPGKVEIGQGILTALAQIAADELDVGLERIRLVPANTATSPDEGMTSGSFSVIMSGMAVRQACAEARSIFLAEASSRLGVPAENLRVEDGLIRSAGNETVSYFDLADAGLLDRNATGAAAPKPASERHWSGRSVERIDLPDKIFGTPRYVHDLTFDGLLHGRVLRPPMPRAKLLTLDEEPVRQMPGVRALVRDGSFVGVVADTEWNAELALRRLRELAAWEEAGPQFPDEGRLVEWLKSATSEYVVVNERKAAQPATPVRTVKREYSRPYMAHASIGPSCAVAQFSPAGSGEPRVRIWAATQGIRNLQKDLALVLGLPLSEIVLQHCEGSGCYGHNGADDVALDAALLARAVEGSPVRVQWSREEELGWSAFGPTMAVAVEADLDADGEICGWRHEIWSNGHTSRPGRGATPTLLAGYDLANPAPRTPAINPPLATGGGSDRNAIPSYDFPSWQISRHHVTDMPIRVSALRALGATANVFAIEGLMDELAVERGENPVAFRLRHLADPRAKAVLHAAAERFGWSERQKREGWGYGVAYAPYKGDGAYCAVIAEVEVEREIRVHRLVIGVDVGEVINPDGVANQIEGGAIQATSWTLKEAVRFDGSRILSTNWDTYPILRFSEVPAVEVVICKQADKPPMGAGEAAQGPTTAAIANAVFDAIGLRVYDLPLTPERIIAAMG